MHHGRSIAAIASLLVCASAHAVDYSAAISADGSGIDLYAITERGVSLVKGSPYVFPQPGVAVPLPVQLVRINAKHDFVYAVYEETPSQDNNPNTIVVGLAISEHGLALSWSQTFEFDPSQIPGTSLSTGSNYAVLYGEPLGVGYGDMIFQQSGKLTYANVGTSLPIVTSVTVDENFKFYYTCHSAAPVPSVNVYDMASANLLVNSTDPVFIASECSAN